MIINDCIQNLIVGSIGCTVIFTLSEDGGGVVIISSTLSVTSCKKK